jgi:hypothetical protein
MAKEAKKQDIVVQEARPLAVVEPTQVNEEILKSDIVVPKVLLMQGLSEAVSKRHKSPDGANIQQGDIIRSTTLEVVGGPDDAVEFIPLTYTNHWRVEEEINGKYEYRGLEPRTAKNEDLPWKFEKDGAQWRRVKVLNVFALLPQDLAAFQDEIKRAQAENDIPDLNKVLLPVVISFRSTSYNAGKAVVTHFAKAASMAKYGAVPYGHTMKLSCKQEENDKGIFYVFDVAPGRKCSKEEVGEAKDWYARLASGPVKIDESDEGIEEGAAPSGPAKF